MSSTKKNRPGKNRLGSWAKEDGEHFISCKTFHGTEITVRITVRK